MVARHRAVEFCGFQLACWGDKIHCEKLNGLSKSAQQDDLVFN